MKPQIATLLLLTLTLAGCTSPFSAPFDCWRDVEPDGEAQALEPTPIDFDANDKTAYADLGFDGETWPDLAGHSLVVLDHGAFDFAFPAAKEAFEALTGATVSHVAADDAGSALQLAIKDQQNGGHSFDVLYGIDNVLMTKAQEADILESYTPLLADRIEEPYRFVPTDDDGAWLATPVDRGYVAINTDANSDLDISKWADLVTHADQFVTEDPRFSSPGLGFLVATVAAFGEDCYLSFWNDLFAGDVTITNGWSEAYENHFSGGYGQYTEGTLLDKPIVTSYTTSPAFEVYYGSESVNQVLLAPESVFEQIETMAILDGTQNRAAAEAWIEFTLTDAFQTLMAPNNAIYPVVENDVTAQNVDSVFGDLDPQPDEFVQAQLNHRQIGAGVETWVRHWSDLYDSHRA